MLELATITVAIKAMQMAFDGIQYCCEALGEGKVKIEEAKSTIEGGVNNAKAIYKEVTGLWSWIQKLLGKKPVEPSKPEAINTQSIAQTPAKSPAKKKQKVVQHIPNEDEIMDRFVEYLSDWFKNYHAAAALLEEAHKEAYAKDVLDPSEILRLTALQTRVDGAYIQLGNIMTNAPWQLGPIWSNFKEMREKVKDEQAKRRNRERVRKLQEKHAAEQESDRKLYRNLTVFYTVLIITYFWWFMFALWQNSSQSTTH